MERRGPGRPRIRDERFSPSKLATAMLDSGRRREYIAAGAELSSRTIEKYLAGDSVPCPEIIEALADVLGIDPDELRDMPKRRRHARAS